ncbi:MAG: NAD(P)H-hydrate dehydratase [Deltaproteobacteria bacterium]|nr:NAD(P)H-hydrate dehydratase [Deltaproteobacteria bacterium]
MRLVRSSEMQEMDRLTIQELGVPGAVLMENAARGATRVFLEHFDPPAGARVLLVCGRGNNGGDGYVMARYLSVAGMDVTVMVLSELDRIRGDALLNLAIIRKMGLEVLEAPGPQKWAAYRDRRRSCDFVVDGILGTGLSSEVRGFYAEVIEEINGLKRPVMAIDMPSGLNADTGQVMGVAVRADLTVTFGFPKIGQLVFPGAGLVGRLVRIDIGIPEGVSSRIPATYDIVEPEDFRELLCGDRPDVHKGDRGHLLVLAGSTGKTGAAALTALGALRAGAGLVTLGIPWSLNPILENKLTEAMTFPLAETSEGSLSLKAEEGVKRVLEGKTALALGPGLSTHEETRTLVRRVMASCPLPMVIDADGLNALGSDPGALAACRGRAILTPHPGEMARLTGLRSAEVQGDRIGVAGEFSKRHGCFLVLKGARTLVAEPDGKVHVNPTGNPALASGGSGDVLTGLIGGFLARGWPIAQAAIGAVYLHGLAADRLAEEMGQAGVLASELLEAIPVLSSALGRGEWPLQGLAPHVDLYQPL